MSSYKSLCTHKGNVHVIEHGKLWIYAGGWSRDARPTEGMLVLDLAGHVSTEAIKITGPLAMTRTKEYHPYTVVRIDWPDMSIPALTKQFWVDLIEDMSDIAEKQDLDVLVMCMGGHGRTGTALAILATLLGHVPDDECPVEWVRKNYCEEAVESSSQLRYIEHITGRKVTATTSSYSYSTSYSYSKPEPVKYYGNGAGSLGGMLDEDYA